MLTIVTVLAHAGEHVKDYDESLGSVSWALAGIALLVAVVAAWMVTPKGDGHH